jgi:hypothetical protein
MVARQSVVYGSTGASRGKPDTEMLFSLQSVVMADDSSIPPPKPVLQFRLQSLLGAMVLVAVFAAIAGPYYRRQSATAQIHLLFFWSTFAVLAAWATWYRWRSAWRLPPSFGAVRFLVHATPKGRRLAWSYFINFLQVAGCLAMFATWSAVVAKRSDRAPLWSPSVSSVQLAFMMGGILLLFLRTPTFLTEDGVASSRIFAPWRYIRHAEWLKNAPEVMKFRRLDGDLFIAVAKRDRVAIEAFVRAKTTLLNPAPHAPEVCDANESARQDRGTS